MASLKRVTSKSSLESTRGCESVADSGINQGNNRIWEKLERISAKVWKSIKDLGVEGEVDEVFKGIV